MDQLLAVLDVHIPGPHFLDGLDQPWNRRRILPLQHHFSLVPQVLDGVEVRGVAGPFQDVDVVVREPLHRLL